MIINPYKHGSRGAKALQAALKLRGIKTTVIQRQPRDVKSIIINWGSSSFQYSVGMHPFIINTPHSVMEMTNKRRFFQRVGHTDLVPKWTTDPMEAFRWQTKVMARYKLEGSGGAGIVVWDPDINAAADFPDNAPLYTKYENKTHEFRIHLGRSFYGKEFAPFLIQRKIFQKTAERPAPGDWNIRNHANGFVFVRESGYPTPRVVIDTARTFMDEHFATLHFVALDVIFHEKSNRAYILEGNTAPGLEGNTINSYAEYFDLIKKELT
jgi:hypothetical protein